jgi:hypothetical protein
MTYQTKKTITSLIASLIILVSYCLSVSNQFSEGKPLNTDLQFWAKQMVTYIVVGVVVTIVLHIVFHIYLSINLAIKEEIKDDKAINHKLELEMIEDEMDKLIELKSMRVGYIVVSIGFVSSLVYLAFGGDIILVLNSMYLSFFIGSLSEGLSNLFFYFKGVRNG